MGKAVKALDAFLALDTLAFLFFRDLFFLNGRGGDGRNGEVTVADNGFDVGRQIDAADMDAVADFKAGQIDDDGFGDRRRRTDQFDLEAHDIEHAAALEPWRLFLVYEHHADVDGDGGARADAQEIHMQR